MKTINKAKSIGCVYRAPFVELGKWRLMWQPWQPRKRDWLGIGRHHLTTPGFTRLHSTGIIEHHPEAKTWRVIPLAYLLAHPAEGWAWLHGGVAL